jgi:hypothetical protein
MATATPTAATVIAIGSGWYQVRTDSGAIRRVVSADRWSLGSRVLILSGSIIGPAGQARFVPVFEV